MEDAQLSIGLDLPRSEQQALTGVQANRVASTDRAFHDWYRFVLAFPPHLVQHYLTEFGAVQGSLILDPFCGTGTTLVEGKGRGCDVLGFEANPVPHLAATAKTDWSCSGHLLRDRADLCADATRTQLRAIRKLRTLPETTEKLLLKGSICPVPLHKVLILREAIGEHIPVEMAQYALTALAKVAVETASNLHFGPEVGVRGRREDADVAGAWQRAMHQMAADLDAVAGLPSGSAEVWHGDARNIGSDRAALASIDAVFTSPPYPNEKDYTRTTRLETVLLGYISSKDELRTLKRSLVRSNTRGVYAADDDERWIAGNERIRRVSAAIEERRLELGKTSGFERMYARVTRLYFGGMARHLAALRPLLRPGALLGYVVGDQASYLRVMIRTGELLAEIAEPLGYEVVRLDLFRTRFATATRQQLREEVLVLRWRGMKELPSGRV